MVELNTRSSEARKLRPVTKTSWITTNPDPNGVRRSRSIKHKHLVPRRRTDKSIRRRSHAASVARARELWEQGTLTHAHTVSGTNRSHKGDAKVGSTLLKTRSESKSVALAISPVTVGNGEVGLSSAREEVVRPEVLDALLLRMLTLILRVRARDENLSVAEEDSFGVVHAGDSGVGEDGHALAKRLLGVIHDCVQVGIVSETEATAADLGSAEDEVAAIGESDHVGHDSLGGLRLLVCDIEEVRRW
jgi:hypothetical protein